MKKYLLFLFIFLLSSVSVYSKTLNFAVASDVHFLENASSNNPGCSYRVLRGFSDRVNENDYAFVVFLGDNIEKSKPSNLKAFFKYANLINKTPFYLVLGERDAHKISGMEKKEYLDIVAKYNKRQKNVDASYSFRINKDLVAIVLDGSATAMPTTHGVFSQKTLQWLDKTLTKYQNKSVIIFQHFPLYEPYVKDSHRILEKTDYKAVFSRHKNVVMIVSGHYHKASVSKDERGVFHVSAPALHLVPYLYQEINLKYDGGLFKKAENFDVEVVEKPAI